MAEGVVDSKISSFTRHYTQADVQAFFQELADEARKPAYGDHAKTYTQALLNRAIERGLYKPPEPE